MFKAEQWTEVISGLHLVLQQVYNFNSNSVIDYINQYQIHNMVNLWNNKIQTFN